MGKNVRHDPPLPVVGGRETFLSIGEWREGGGREGRWGVGMQPQNARLSSQTK